MDDRFTAPKKSKWEAALLCWIMTLRQRSIILYRYKKRHIIGLMGNIAIWRSDFYQVRYLIGPTGLFQIQFQAAELTKVIIEIDVRNK